MENFNIESIVVFMVLGAVWYLVIFAKKSEAKLYARHERLKDINIKLLDYHPRGKSYKVLRAIFFTLTFAFGASLFLSSIFNLWEYMSAVCLITALFCGLLLIFFSCPNCKKSIFLQDLNNLKILAPPIVCISCGFPNDTSFFEKESEYQSVRPLYKWLGIVFLGMPILLIIFAVLKVLLEEFII